MFTCFYIITRYIFYYNIEKISFLYYALYITKV